MQLIEQHTAFLLSFARFLSTLRTYIIIKTIILNNKYEQAIILNKTVHILSPLLASVCVSHFIRINISLFFFIAFHPRDNLRLFTG